MKISIPVDTFWGRVLSFLGFRAKPVMVIHGHRYVLDDLVMMDDPLGQICADTGLKPEEVITLLRNFLAVAQEHIA